MATTSSESQVRAALAAQQWEEWRLTRRHLIKAGAFGGSLAFGSVIPAVRPFVRSVAAQDQPKSGGTINMSLADSDVQNFDPIVPYDNMSIWTMLLIYDQVIRVGPDGLDLEPGLAETWEATPDGLTYTFHLRDANFHDGSPCTSADVAYCLNRTVFAEGSGYAFLFAAVDTIEAPDPKTLVVHLKFPWAPFEADLALYGASIIPKALHEAQGDELFQNPIGTGPFKFVSWDKDVQVVLEKNPDYWTEGQPYLDELTFHVLTDGNTRMLRFQGGELDIVTDVPFSQLDALRSNSDVVVLQDAVARIDYIGINVSRPPFDDKRVRQAINYAINKDEIIQNVLFGAGEPANTYLPKMAFHDDEAPGYPFDLAKAQALLAETAAKDGFEAELIVGTGDPVGAQVAQLVAAHLDKIGGSITITSLENAASQERININQDYGFYKGYYTTDIIDPDELTTFAVVSTGGALSVWTLYKNEQVDTLAAEAAKMTDIAQRTQAYKDLQAIVADDAHFIYLYYPTGRTATASYVKNFHILATGNYRLWETWRDDV